MPLIAKYFYSIASILLTGYFLFISQALISPLIAALIIALALNPMVKKIQSLKIPRIISTLITIVVFIVIIFALISFFSTQIGGIDFDLGSWKIKLNSAFDRIQNLISATFGVTFEQQASLVKESMMAFVTNSSSLIKQTLSLTTYFMSSLVLFVISLFFFLYYSKFIVSFLYKCFKSNHQAKLQRTLVKIQSVVQHYIFGLSLIVTIVAVLNTTGLLILNIEHAFIFGLLSAVLTIIPYIGITVGALLPIIFALSTKNSLWYPAGVLFTFMFVQFLEGNFLTPNIVGKQVSVNPLAAILGLIIGGMLLGVIGVIFAIPIIAIIKVICDEVTSLKPVGYLLGNPLMSLEH